MILPLGAPNLYSAPMATRPRPDPGSSEWWRQMLTDPDYHFERYRRLFLRLPSPPHCKICGAPFAGPGGFVMGRLGFRPWDKNPSICRTCIATIGRYPPDGAEIDCTLLFADIRSSTDLAEHSSASDFAVLLRRFYQVGSAAVVAENGIVDKFVGDEVMGLFIPAFAPRHALAAVRTARRLLLATGHGGHDRPWLPIGVGVHSGAAFVGSVAVESQVTDFTALGDTVNLASRLASSAGSGEVYVSEAAARAAGLPESIGEARQVELRGHEAPIIVRVATPESLAAIGQG
jgi:adenylate cyclase